MCIRDSGNNYVTRFNQAHKSEELQLTDKFKRYSFTFTTSPTTGSTWVGIHPPHGSDSQGGLFWGHQLEKRSSPSTYIYTYNSWNFNSPQVSLGEGYTQWANNYPNSNAKPGNVYQYARIGSDWMMYNQNQNQNYYHIMEVESATVTAVTGYTQIGSGAYNGHTYWRSTGTGHWNTASQTTIPNISTSEIPAGVDKYLFVPNSQAEYNFIKNSGMSTSNYWIGIFQLDTATSNNSDWIPVRGNFSAINQGFKEKIEPLEVFTLEYNHTITQEDVNAGGVSNTITVTAGSHNVSDTSDDGDDTDGNTTDDQTGVPINVIRLIEVTKSATVSDVDGDGVNSVGDIITYTISVTNSGTVDLSSYSISDTLTDGNSTTLSCLLYTSPSPRD